MAKSVRRGVYAIVITMGLLLTGLYFFQESLIFPAQQLPGDFQFESDIPFSEGFLEAKDGARLNFLRLKAKEPKGIIVYYHGNGGSLERWKDIVSPFTDMGWDILVWDYRGYGKSTGKRTSEALYDDAQQIYVKALEWFEEDNILVYGRSMGTTFATYVSARNNPSVLVLESPFYSLQSLVKEKYSILPIYRFLKFELPTFSFAAAVSSPVYLFHGTEDDVVPYEQGAALWSEFGSLGEFITIEGGDHNNLSETLIYQQKLTELLDQFP